MFYSFLIATIFLLIFGMNLKIPLKHFSPIKRLDFSFFFFDFFTPFHFPFDWCTQDSNYFLFWIFYVLILKNLKYFFSLFHTKIFQLRKSKLLFSSFFTHFHFFFIPFMPFSLFFLPLFCVFWFFLDTFRTICLKIDLKANFKAFFQYKKKKTPIFSNESQFFTLIQKGRIYQ